MNFFKMLDAVKNRGQYKVMSHIINAQPFVARVPDDNILYRIKRKNKKELESAGDETNEFIYISGKRARAVLQKLEGGK